MAKYRVTAPDGSTYDVSAPDTASQDEVLNYARAHAASLASQPNPNSGTVEKRPAWASAPIVDSNKPAWASAPVVGTPAPAEKPPVYQGPLNNMGIGLQGVGQGAAHLLGAPVDIFTTLANGVSGAVNSVAGHDVLTKITNPVGGSESIANVAGRAARAVGYPVYDPAQMTDKQRQAYSINDFLGQAVGGGQALARTGGAMAAPYIEAPAKAFVRDVGTGVGAGEGNNFAQEHFGDSPIAQLFGTLFGGFGGHALTNIGESLGRAGANFISGHAPDPVLRSSNGAPLPKWVGKDAAKQFQGYATDPAEAANTVGQNADTFTNLNLPVPSTGSISNDLGLQSAESAARIKDPVSFATRDNQLRAAATDRVGSLVDPTADQGAVPRAAQAERANRLAPLEKGVTQAQEALDAGQAQRQAEAANLALANNAETRANASTALDKNLLEDIVAPARQAKNEAFNALDPNRTQMVDVSPILAQIEDLKQRITQLAPTGQQLPGEFTSKLDTMAGKNDGTAPLGDLVDVRKYLAPAEESARKAGNFDLATSTGALKKSINQTIETVPEAKAANEVYQNQFVPVARTGGEVENLVRSVERDPQRMTTPPSATAGRFTSGPEKMADLQAVLGRSPKGAEGKAALQDYVRSDFAKAAMNEDGTINPYRAHRYLANNQDVLAQFPEAQKELTDYVTAARRGEGLTKEHTAALKAARGNLQQVQAEVDRSVVGTLLNKDPRDVASGILNGGYDAGKKLDEINAIVKNDPQAQRGWKAAMAEVLRDKVSGTTKINTDSAQGAEQYRTELGKLDKMFKDNEDVLAKVYSPEEMNKLRQAHKVLEPLKNTSVKATAGSQTTDKAVLFGKLEKAIRLTTGALQGGAIVRKLRIMMSVLPDGEQTIENVVHSAWFDPEIATYLLSKELPKEGAKAPPNIVNRLVGATAFARAEGKEK